MLLPHADGGGSLAASFGGPDDTLVIEVSVPLANGHTYVLTRLAPSAVGVTR